jgi:hypothetical protein
MAASNEWHEQVDGYCQTLVNFTNGRSQCAGRLAGLGEGCVVILASFGAVLLSA